jgi:cytochrome c
MESVRKSLIDWTMDNDHLLPFIVIYMGYTTLELRKSSPELYNVYIQGMLHPSNDKHLANDKHLVAALLRYFEFYNKQFKESIKNLEDNIKELHNSRFNALKEYADKVDIQLIFFDVDILLGQYCTLQQNLF